MAEAGGAPVRKRARSLNGHTRSFALGLAYGALSLGHSVRAIAPWLAGEVGITLSIADGLARKAAAELKARQKAAAIDKYGGLFVARVDAGIAAASRSRKDL